MTAPAQRPKLGRPANASFPSDVSLTTDANLLSEEEETPPVSRLNRFPQQPTDGPQPSSKQSGTQSTGPTHATSNVVNREPASRAEARENLNESTGPPPAKPFTRPQRSTRNPSPNYVDAIWVASDDDIAYLNQAISSNTHSHKYPV